ncbi:endonuclease I family protein [Brevibacillus dissolubilis]|uniref:endonuclease I family protein n=1 Tax=Brevibacillus dissolubilis TaxID=1844116 RepID=UPI0011170303|nr:endonuclease [Brevibacillus dissolubilis]
MSAKKTVQALLAGLLITTAMMPGVTATSVQAMGNDHSHMPKYPIAQPVDSDILGDYYETIQGQTGTALKKALHQIIQKQRKLNYSEVWSALMKTDQDPNNPNNVILIYTGRSQAKSSNEGNIGSDSNAWNREHVWAKSHGGFGTANGAGTDLHHLRPADKSVNSDRDDFDFDELPEDQTFKHPEAKNCEWDKQRGIWEPRDEVKGDVARMMLYMAVRYEGGNGEPDLELVNSLTDRIPKFGVLSTLLQWHAADPVDNFERNRNEVIYDIQGNRNPFIDHPEWVSKIWQ